MSIPTTVYAAVGELPLRRRKSKATKGGTTTVLLGAWLKVLEQSEDWYKVAAFGAEGWVHIDDVATESNAVKFFFVDVGQGDGILIETPTERIIVDGGAGKNFANYLTKFKYKWQLNAGQQVHIDTMIVSHFDADHFAGLISLINDSRFTFGTIYHNGIPRFQTRSADRPAKYDTDLGKTSQNTDGHRATLETTFSTVTNAKKLLEGGGLMATFEKFLKAVVTADDQDRLKKMKRVTAGSTISGLASIDAEVLGPIPKAGNPKHFEWFEDSSHTRNGHSVVVKFTVGERSFLLGGDLNAESEENLLATLGGAPFRVDVAKACHHGASEFSTNFLKAMNPLLTVISSGDNENYGHPQPDALGSIGKWSRGPKPLIFSTELARSTSATAIHYGLVNVRTDGEIIIGAQMFEKARRGDMWNSYVI